jgi:hypothetical protein
MPDPKLMAKAALSASGNWINGLVRKRRALTQDQRQAMAERLGRNFSPIKQGLSV